MWKSAFKEYLLPEKAGISDTEFLTQKLQFIYKRLKAHGTKDCVMRLGCDLQGCFLYCALFPQDKVINISKLLECWAQEGLITGNVVEPCEKGHEIVKIFLDAAVLESVEPGHSIKMHKVIRDFALELVLPEVEARRFLVMADFKFMQPPKLGSSSLSGSFDQYLLKAGEGITKAPLDEEWEQAKIMFLMDNELASLPVRPKCYNLSGLFLQRNHCLKAIPVSFFNHMPFLQALNLSNTGITCLPKSISNLKRLKELMMRDCEHLVNLPSQLGGLQRLEVLDLHRTEIDKLPRNIGQLAFLKCMRVHFYGSVDHVECSMLPSELYSKRTMSRLLCLRILSIVVMPGDLRWIKVAEAVTNDICKLRSLIDLSFYFPQVDLLHLFVESSPSWRGNDLRKFNFVAGHDVKHMISRVPYNVDFEFNQRGQRLRFVNGENVPDAVCKVLRRTTAFYLDHHLKIHSLSQFGVHNMTWLEVCVAKECPELEIITDSEKLAFPLLQLLTIHYLENLKGIWRGSLPAGSFASLKYLNVYTCCQLNFVLTSSMTQYISNLEELVVVDCSAMTKLVNEDKDKIVKPGDVLLPRLKTLTLHYLPQLVCVWQGSWPSLEHISFYNCPNLRSLNIDFDTKLTSSIKEIKAEIDWWSNLEWKDSSLSQKLQAFFAPLDGNEGSKI
uniref:Uncharacterized protein MANES_11G129900 n=1 Tax=Rhizophora mucronata TaxID=61149 RepID=A0A2P2MX89_RHIMU